LAVIVHTTPHTAGTVEEHAHGTEGSRLTVDPTGAGEINTLVRRRDAVLADLRGQGWDGPDSQADFVWLPLGERALEFAADCPSPGIAVRPFPGEGHDARSPSRRPTPACWEWRPGSRPGRAGPVKVERPPFGQDDLDLMTHRARTITL
jgi:hypothetical protein